MSPPFRPPESTAGPSPIQPYPELGGDGHRPALPPPSYRSALTVGLLAAGVLGLSYFLHRTRSEARREDEEHVSLGMDIGSTYDEILTQSDAEALDEESAEAFR